MSISIRTSIAWNGGSPSEDTDTLVLTGHTYFVDMRVLKKPTGTTSPALDWAFAGTRTIVRRSDGSTHCTWQHAVDSRTRHPSSDEGTIDPVDPADPLRAVERGRMVNPATGRVEPYVEVWRDEALPTGTRAAFMEREDGGAFIGVIGGKRLGVGGEWAWRMNEGEVVYEVGSSREGMDIKLEGNLKAGDKVGRWIVREFWETSAEQA